MATHGSATGLVALSSHFGLELFDGDGGDRADTCGVGALAVVGLEGVDEQVGHVHGPGVWVLGEGLGIPLGDQALDARGLPDGGQSVGDVPEQIINRGAAEALAAEALAGLPHGRGAPLDLVLIAVGVKTSSLWRSWPFGMYAIFRWASTPVGVWRWGGWAPRATVMHRPARTARGRVLRSISRVRGLMVGLPGKRIAAPSIRPGDAHTSPINGLYARDR